MLHLKYRGYRRSPSGPLCTCMSCSLQPAGDQHQAVPVLSNIAYLCYKCCAYYMYKIKQRHFQRRGASIIEMANTWTRP